MRYLFIFFLLLVFSINIPASGWAQALYYDYRDMGGDWQNRNLGNRIVLVADGRGQMGYFDIEVPRDGYYKIYSYIMHRWNSAWPLIETRILQDDQILQEGYFTAEPGELSHQGAGRWHIKSIDRGEEPYLQKGNARIEFRLNSRKKIREKQEGEIEGEVYLWCFIVIPGNGDKSGVMNLLEAERSLGDWEKIEYRREDHAGIIESTPGRRARLEIYVPQAGTYQLAALLRNEDATELRVAVSRNEKDFEEHSQVPITRDNFWKMQQLVTARLDKGTYYVEIENTTTKKVWIDSFLLVPHYPVKKRFNPTLSCSTVFFYHNKGAGNLAEGITGIIKAGFRDIDIVAYDDKVGFGDDVTAAEVSKIRKLMSRLGGGTASVHFGYIPLRTEEQAVERIQWALWIARILGAKRIVAPASLDIDGEKFLSKEQGLQRLSSVISRIRPILEQSGVELGIENHGGRQWLFQGADDFLSARELLSRKITFVLDEEHFSLSGEKPKNVFTLLLPYSRYIHFKSKNEKYIRELADILLSSEFGGDISLEVEKDGLELNDWYRIYRNVFQL
jgi:sugar phosphate isomerase/epimerase